LHFDFDVLVGEETPDATFAHARGGDDLGCRAELAFGGLNRLLQRRAVKP
jgi:hypothetical protein